MANYTQPNLLVPIIIALGKSGEPMATDELYPVLMSMLSPWGDDLKPYAGRKDSIFTQTIRNFTAPERLTEFNKTFVKNEDGKLSLTDFGQKVYDAIFSTGTGSPKKKTNTTYPVQIIFYGAPGTGKSYRIAKDYDLTAGNTFRTTFHPDTDYASFVGCYKPTTKGDKVSYSFTEQVFTDAYVKAWKYYSKWQADCETKDQGIETELEYPKPVYLIIDEINRGNCAQIFGDIFQLLDRNDEAFSDYEIQPDADLKNCISKKGITSKNIFNQKGIDISSQINDGSLLKFPPNLCIIATMNTSDQSLYPMDSAFKRRWDWEFVRIDYAAAAHIWVKVDNEEYYNWGELIRSINAKINEATSSADKQIGNWFVRVGKDNTISLKKLVNKVLFYLWNDIYKDFDKDDDGYIFGNIENFESFFEPEASDDMGTELVDGINLKRVKDFIGALNDVHLYSKPSFDSRADLPEDKPEFETASSEE